MRNIKGLVQMPGQKDRIISAWYKTNHIPRVVFSAANSKLDAKRLLLIADSVRAQTPFNLAAYNLTRMATIFGWRLNTE